MNGPLFQVPWIGGAARKAIRPALSVAAGLGLGLLIAAASGENPWQVLLLLCRSNFGSAYDFGMMLFYATPLIFTGLSVSMAFQARLFNIGAEGQLNLGALGAASVGILLPGLPAPLAPLLAIVAAFSCGALWGSIAGWLRARRESHEVITTIMLNFIAAGIVSYVTLYLLKNPESQNPETASIGSGYILSNFRMFDEAPVSLAIFLAIAVAICVHLFLSRSIAGFELRAVGASEPAARIAGIDPGRARIQAMVLAGGIAGLVAVGEVLGNAHRFKLEFSSGYGFTGIAVALLAGGKPLAVIPSSLLFAALHKGASDLDLDTEKLTRDFSLILQASVILFVSANGLWDIFSRKMRKALAGR